MSTLRNAEGAISGFFDRIFGRVFRGYVEPVELARKLAREMEDHKTVSVSRVYVPNEYVVYLSDKDYARFESFQGALTQDLGMYLSERARHEGFTLLSDPVIRIEVDQDLTVGAYGIACRVVDVPVDGAEPAPSTEREPEPEFPATTARPIGTRDDPFSPFVPAQPPPPAPVVAVDDDAAIVSALDDAHEHDEYVSAPSVDEGAPDEPVAPVDIPDEDVAAENAPVEGVPDEREPVAPAVADMRPAAALLDDDPHHADWPRVPIIPDAPEPVPPAALIPPAPTPDPVPPARPLPPPGDYEPLAGVSGTQIFQTPPEQAMVHEEVSLIIGGRRVRVTRRTTTMGRSRDCDIPVSDPNASRMHAEIRHIGLDYFLVDLNATNGTYVNGQRIRRHALADGDRITIGTTEMIVEHITVERG